MLTAESITDEQIRELLHSAEMLLPFEFQRARANELRNTIAICDSALNPKCHEARKLEARARCAEILNERAKAVTP